MIVLVLALITCAHLDQREGYAQYFVGSGDDYDDVRESDRLQRLALILGISGYWVYIAVVIAAAVGLRVGSKHSSKCLPATWFLTAVVSFVSVHTHFSRGADWVAVGGGEGAESDTLKKSESETRRD